MLSNFRNAFTAAFGSKRATHLKTVAMSFTAVTAKFFL